MKHSLILLFVGLLLTSCAQEAGTRTGDPGAADYDASFGLSVRQNIAAQTANPEAPTADTFGADGTRVTEAQRRYKADEVESPKSSNTMQNVSGGGGSEE
jgi:type IV pilus biogenesis protein CpaD/CtpE